MFRYLLDYSKKIYPFHMPGHKLGRLTPLKDINLYNIDTTEVNGTDNLFQANGIIKAAQDRAKSLYGSLDTFFLVNGSTSGILTAISACCKQDGKILISRNCHKSVYNSILINRLTPIYIYPEYISSFGLLGGIDSEKIERALKEYHDISCVVITSPTYEGFTSDIEVISEIVHKYNKILIIDEAHGAHFPFHEKFPKSSIDSGADIVIHSLHKTLPAFTQSALLHVCSRRVDLEKIKEYLSIYQTSSPSYILMSGIDSCLELIEKNGQALFGNLIDNINNFRNKAKDFKNIQLIGNEIIGKYKIKNIDLSKLVIVGKDKSINGNKIEKMLREKYNIQVEMSAVGSLIALSSISDTNEGFENFFSALKEIDLKNDYINSQKFDIINKIRANYSPYEISYMKAEKIPLEASINRISAGFITLYPPGIPIIVPGEVITEEIIINIKKYMENKLNLLGLEQNNIKVVERGNL